MIGMYATHHFRDCHGAQPQPTVGRTTPRRHSPVRRIRLGIIATVLLVLVLVLLLASPALAFPDVPAGHPYETAINALSDEGIIGGYLNGNFGLNDAVKRAQFAKMIVGTLGITPNSSTVTRFTDLGDPDAKGYPHIYVQAAYDNGITYGSNLAQTLFDPWKYIHRDQMVSMIVRGVQHLFPTVLQTPPVGTSSLFTDVPEPHGANLRIAEYNGLLDGLIGLGPSWSVTANATRGEVAQVLYNLLNLLGPSGVWVYADGSGDYPTIEAAVADIDPGTTIHLGPGIFNLAKTILVDFSFNLVGSGMEGPTSSTVRYAGWAVDVHSVSFSAKDIRFECTATNKAADVLEAGDATVDLVRCYFSGGNRYADQYGAGLYLYGSAEATVTDCVFTLNDLHGIVLGDQAKATVTNSAMSDNVYNGIGLFDGSSAIVDHSDCTNNGLHGISANDSSEVTVLNSICSNNGDGGDYASGIYLEEDAVGTIQNCVCNSNLIDGISTHDNAQLTLTNNTCNNNGEDGITFSEHVTGTIRNCECSHNSGYDGIDVHDNAYAVVENNLCVGNHADGIWFGDFATGIVRNNECAENHWGLYVDATANPTVGVNNLHDNVIDLFLE